MTFDEWRAMKLDAGALAVKNGVASWDSIEWGLRVEWREKSGFLKTLTVEQYENKLREETRQLFGGGWKETHWTGQDGRARRI